MSQDKGFDPRGWLISSSERDEAGKKKRRASSLSTGRQRAEEAIARKYELDQDKRQKKTFDLTHDNYKESLTGSESDSFSNTSSSNKSSKNSEEEQGNISSTNKGQKPTSAAANTPATADLNQQIAETIAKSIIDQQLKPPANDNTNNAFADQGNTLQMLLNAFETTGNTAKTGNEIASNPTTNITQDQLLQIFSQRTSTTGQAFNNGSNGNGNSNSNNQFIPQQSMAVAPPLQHQPNPTRDTTNDYMLQAFLGLQQTTTGISPNTTVGAATTPPAPPSSVTQTLNGNNSQDTKTNEMDLLHALVMLSGGNTTCSPQAGAAAAANTNNGNGQIDMDQQQQLLQLMQFLPQQQQQQMLMTPSNSSSVPSQSQVNAEQLLQALLSQMNVTGTNTQSCVSTGMVQPSEGLMQQQQQQQQNTDAEWLLQQIMQQQQQQGAPPPPPPPPQPQAPEEQDMMQQFVQALQQSTENNYTSAPPPQPTLSSVKLEESFSAQPAQGTNNHYGFSNTQQGTSATVSDAMLSVLSRLSSLSDSKPSPQVQPERWVVTEDSDNCHRLDASMDNERLSPYQVFIRKQLEYFVSKRDDADHCVQGRKKRGRLGQVGIRCKHCAHFPHRLRGRGSCYYPAKLRGIYQASQNMASNHLMQFCSCIPDDIREQLQSLRSTRHDSAAGAGKQYWADTAKEIGIYEEDEEDGLKLQGYSPPKEDFVEEDSNDEEK